MARNRDGGMRAKRLTGDIVTYIILASMCVIWLTPFFWVIMQSFRDGVGNIVSSLNVYGEHLQGQFVQTL